jgi:phosphoinositide-3-kinase regulatory subunit 4
MGNAGSLKLGTVTNDPKFIVSYFQTDLPRFIIQDRIGNGKFMKTYYVKVDGAPIVVKVYLKQPDEDLQSVALHLSHIWKTLSPARYPNLLPYQMWIKSSRPKTQATPVYLIRQYIFSNLHDRLSTRPFLAEVEKLWLMYQLFKGVEVCHSHGIIHGDIKPENVLCTSWNWLILTDFGPFKPAMLPDDDPTDFQFYFDTMGRSSCYIAPERFFRREVKGAYQKQATLETVSLQESQGEPIFNGYILECANHTSSCCFICHSHSLVIYIRFIHLATVPPSERAVAGSS